MLTHLHSRDAARPPARHWRCATVTKLHSQAIHAIVMFFNDTLNMLNIGLSTFFCSMLLTIAEMHVLATLIITTFSTTTAIATIDGVVTEPPRSNFFYNLKALSISNNSWKLVSTKVSHPCLHAHCTTSRATCPAPERVK